jgi:site-specific DNA-methyltransferase (adenine-specific)
MTPKIETRLVADLIPYAANSRTHSDAQVAQIAASIKEFGWTNPILIDDDNTIIAGHGRLLAARKLGMEEVPAIILDHLTKAQQRALVIADNQLALNAGWDMDMLKAEIEDLSLEDFNLDLLGFDEKFLDGLLEPEPKDGLTDEDAVPEVPETPKTVLGDVWVLDNHRLMCGDSTSIDALQTLTEGALVDMWLTDPPYNVDMTAKNEMLEKAGKARKDKSSFGIANDAMSDDDFRQFLRDAYSAADAVMKPGAVFYIWHADSEGYNFRGAARDTAWIVRQCLIWRKSVFAIGRSDYHWKHEPCLYGWKDGAGHLWSSDRKQTTVLEFDKPSKSGEHPTMKPVELFEYQMLNNTKGADIVLDSFGGSGTTMIAAEKHGRHARIMELDPKYCDVIIKRWQDFSGKVAIHAETGEAFDG